MATLQSAGEFEIKFASITTSSGIELRIDASQLANVTFFENINQSAVTGSIQVFDSAALSSIGPLIGQEYLKLKILTPGQQVEVIDFTENVLHIYKVSQRSRLSPNTQAYTLDFISSEGLKNTRIKLSRAVTGSYSEIVEKMLDEVGCKKKRFIEPTNELKKMVIANKYPFDVINMCKEKLRPIEKEIIDLYFEKGFKEKEIAQRLNISTFLRNYRLTYNLSVLVTRTIPNIGLQKKME